MVYVPVEKPPQPQRKRRATEAAVAGMEQEDFDDVPMETPKTRKKRRTTHGTRPSLLDLSDPVCFLILLHFNLKIIFELTILALLC